MVQTMVFDSMGLEERLRTWSWAITLIFKLTPWQPMGIPLSAHWPSVSQWLPHVQYLLQQWDKDNKLRTQDRKLSDNPLLMEIGRIWAWLLYEQGKLTEASGMIEISFRLAKQLIQSLTEHVKKFPADPPPTSIQSVDLLYSDLLSIRSTLSLERNEPRDALQGFKEARAIRERIHEEALELLTSNANIAFALLLIETESSVEEATKLFEAVITHPLTRSELVPKYNANLALCHLFCRRLPEALEAIQTSLRAENDNFEKAQ